MQHRNPDSSDVRINKSIKKAPKTNPELFEEYFRKN
jgi:hypothetical protein